MAFNASKLVVSVDAALNQASVLTARKQLTAAFSTIRGLNVPASDPRQVMSFRAKVDTATGSVNKITASLKEANTQATTFANLLALKGINFASYVAASSAVLQLAGAFSQGVREALRFEKELAVLSQTESSLSTEQLQKYSAELLNISRRYSLSQAKVTELTRVFAQAGQTIEDSVKAANELAKTTLVGTFESVSNTQEALIATMQAFNKTADDTASILNTINVVSKKYAVESDDLVEVIKRTGGAFKAASNEALDSGKELEQLLALFTSVRSFSRESPETIATAFRTIIGRLQRSDTVEYFKNLGIELRDTEGNFVGVYTAINKISDALRSTPTGSAVFSDIVEQIGGVRQISKVIPLLTQTRVAQEALNAALSKTAETDADVAKAKETLAFRIDQVQTKFSALITELTQSTTFKMTANLFIDMSEAAIELARSLKEVIPLLSFVYAGKVFAGIPRAIGRLNSPLGRNSGGSIPGVGNRDTVPAMLTPGEFVIKKSSAQKIGYSNLLRMNATGVQYFSAGGISDEDSVSRQQLVEAMQRRLEDIEIEEREKPLKSFAALVSTVQRKHAEYYLEPDQIKKEKIWKESEAMRDRAISLAETFDVGQKRKVKREIFGLGPSDLLSGPPNIRDVVHAQADQVSAAGSDAWITRLLKLAEEKEVKRINREKASQSIAGEKRDYADQRAAELKSFLGREIGSTQPSQHGRLSDSPLGILPLYDDRGVIQERRLPPGVKVLNENIDTPLDKPWSEILATKSSIPISASTPAYQNIRKVLSQIESQISSDDDLSFFADKKKTLNENFDEWQDRVEASKFAEMMSTPGGIADEVARIQSNLSRPLGDMSDRALTFWERQADALSVGRIDDAKNPKNITTNRSLTFEELRNQILEIAQGRKYQGPVEASSVVKKPSWRQEELYDRLTRNLEGNVPKATSDITTFEGMKSHLDVLIPFFNENATESQKQKSQAEKQAAKDLRDKVIKSLGPIKDYLPAYDTFEDISTSILDEMNTAYRVGGSRAGFAQQNKLAREENDFEKLSLDDFLTSRGILPSGGMGGNVQKGASLKQLNKAIFYANQGAFDADTKRKLADFDRTKLGQASNNSGFIVDLVDDIRKRAEELSKITEKYEAAKRAGGGELPIQTISDTTTLAEGPLSRNIRRAKEAKETKADKGEATLAPAPSQSAESSPAAPAEPTKPTVSVAPAAVDAGNVSATKLLPRKRRKWTNEEIELARQAAKPKLKKEGIDPLTIPIGQRYERKSANQSLSTGEEKGTISKRKKRTKKDITVVESTTLKSQADNSTPGDCCSKLIAKLEEIRKLILKLSKTNASQVSSSQPKAAAQSNKQVAQEQRERLNSIKQQKTEAKIKAEEAKLAMAQAKAQKLQEKAAAAQVTAAGSATISNSNEMLGGQAAFRQLYPSRQTSWTQQYGPPLPIIETIRRQQAAKLNSQALPPNFIGPPTPQQNTARIIGSIKNNSAGRLAQGYDSLNDNMMQYTAALLTTISVLATTQKQYDKNGEALDNWNNKLIDSVAQISLWTAVLSGLPGVSLLFDKLDIFGKISKSAKIGSLGGFGAGFKAASKSSGPIDSLALAEKVDSVRYGQGNKEGYLNRKYGPNTVTRIKNAPTGATLSGVRIGSFLRPVVKFGEAVSAAVPAILALVAAGYAVYQFKEYLLDSFYDLKNNKRIREDAIEAGNVEIASQLAEDEVIARQKSSKFISDASKIPGIGPIFGLIDSIDKYSEWANKSTENLVKQTKISAQVQRSGIEMRKSNKTLASGKNQSFDETLKTIDTSIQAYSNAIKASADIDPKKLSGTSLEIYEQNKKEVEQLGQFLSETKDSLLRTTQEIYASGDSATEEQRAANAKQYMDIETAIRKTKGESGILTKEMQVLLQELKDGQEAAKQNGQLENRLATSTRNIRKRELALIEERSKREYQLGKSLNFLITSADRLESAFSLLENIANPTESTKISTSSASQLSNLSEIYDIEQIKRDVSSVISAGTEIEKNAGEDVAKALQLKSKIDDVNNYGIDGIVQQVLTLNKASFSQDQDKTGIVENQKRLFDRKISDFFSGVLSTTELKKLSDDYAKAFEENQGLLSSQNIQDLLTQVIEGRFKASIELIRQKISNTTDSLNKFSSGLRQSAQLNEQIYQSEIARLQSSQSAENRLREILSGQPLTADTLRSNTISRQSIILGEDQAIAGNANALSNEIIQLQKKIAEKEAEIKGRGVNVSLSLLREQDKNKVRLDRLNQALQDQIDSFDELRSATEEIISAEKQRSDQLRAESIEKITKPLEERAQEAKAFAIAQSVLAKQQNPKLNDIQKYGMLTAQATTYVNPQMQSQFQLNQQLIISELQKIAESGGAQSAGAKEALDKLAMFSTMFNQGISQQAMFGSVLTDKQLAQIKKKQPAIADQLDKIFKDFSDQTQSSFGKLTVKGRQAEADYVRLINEEKDARRSQIDTMKTQSEMFNESLERFSLNIDFARESIKKLTDSLPGAKGESSVEDFFKFLFPVEPEVKGVDVPDKKEAEKFLNQAGLFKDGSVKLATGGEVGNIFRPKGTDTVPAMLTPGEYVLRKATVDSIGVDNLERINKTGTLYASDGGPVPEDEIGTIDWKRLLNKSKRSYASQKEILSPKGDISKVLQNSDYGRLKYNFLTFIGLPPTERESRFANTPYKENKQTSPTRIDYSVGTGVPIFSPEIEVPRRENAYFSNFSQNPVYWFMRSLQGDSVWKKPMAMPDVQYFDYTVERAQRTLDKIENEKILNREKSKAALANITKPVSEGGQGKKFVSYEEIARQRGWKPKDRRPGYMDRPFYEEKMASDSSLKTLDQIYGSTKQPAEVTNSNTNSGDLKDIALTYAGLMMPSLMKMGSSGLLMATTKETPKTRMRTDYATGNLIFSDDDKMSRREDGYFSNFSENPAYWFMRSLQGDSVWEKPMAMPDVQYFDYTVEKAQRTLDKIENEKLATRERNKKALESIKFGKPRQATFDESQEKKLSESLDKNLITGPDLNFNLPTPPLSNSSFPMKRPSINPVKPALTSADLLLRSALPKTLSPKEDLVPLPKDIQGDFEPKKPQDIKNIADNADRLKYLKKPKFSSYGQSASSRMLRLGRDYFDQNLPKSKISRSPSTQRNEKDIKSSYLLSLEKARSAKSSAQRAKDIRDARKKYNEEMKNFRKSKYSAIKEKKKFMQLFMSSGGFVDKDTVPAMLSPGEFVLTKSATDKIGRGNLDKVNRFAKGGFVTTKGPATGGTTSQFSTPDFSSLLDGISSFSSSFGAQVDKLIAMPKVFEISLSSMGVNVNLNGAELLAKLPDLMRLTILETIQSQIGVITESVKKNLSGGY